MKKIVKILTVSIVSLIIPISVLASPTSVDRLTNHIEPLIKSDYIKAPYFTASSTTASTFPYASTTALSVSGLTSGRIPVAGFGGLLKDYSALTFDGTNFKVEGNAEIGVLGEGNLSIRDSGGGTVIYLSGNTTDSYFNNGSANFGVGTTIPLAKLHVQDTSGPQFRVGYNVSNYYDTSISSTGGVTFDSVGTGSKFSFLDNVGIGTTSPYAKLSVVGQTVSEYFTATSTTATSTFSGGLAVGSNALNVLQNGNLGIGTASPVASVHIRKSSWPAFRFDENGTTVFDFTANSSHFYVTNPSSSAYLWDIVTNGNVGLGGTAANTAPKLFIHGSTGNVGIGSTTPFGKLSIKGDGTSTGKTMVVSNSSNNIIMSILDNGKVKIGSTTPATNLFDVDGVISSGADGNIGGGEIRSYQVPGFYVSLTTNTSVNKSGVLRSNASGDKFFVYYNTSTGDTVLNNSFSATGNVIFSNLDVETGRIRNGLWSVGAVKFPAHTLDITQPAISTAKTASYDAIKATNTATSSTASVRMSGIETVVTGANSGAGASNVGVYVSSVSGGTANYDAIFNGSAKVGIGSTTPQTNLVVQGYTQSVIASGVATSTCNTAIEGSQVYNLGNHHLWLCMGSEPWTLLK